MRHRSWGDTASGEPGSETWLCDQTGNPDSFQADLDRYKAVSAADVQRVVRQYLRTNRVMASVVPQGKPELAAKKAVIQ